MIMVLNANLSIFVYFMLYLGITSSQQPPYDYGAQSSWYDKYPQCIMDRQSPIELISTEARLSYDTLPISFNYTTKYFAPVLEKHTNSADSIILAKPATYNATQWLIDDQELPSIGGALLPGSFIAESIHFHWGSNYTHGSEHVMDGKRYAMEMHIVHRNTKYQTIGEAQSNWDGLAVIGVLFNADAEVDFDPLNNIIAARESDDLELVDISLDTLLGDIDRGNFFTYNGSLTTPPCSQSVTWNVFQDTIPITREQMQNFHDSHVNNGVFFENNYRALQPKGLRTVQLRKNPEVMESHVELLGIWKSLTALSKNLK